MHLQVFRKAFTILELLIAVTILMVMVMVLGRVVNSTAVTVERGRGRLDVDSEVRQLFERLAIDLSRMPRRGDLYYLFEKQEGNDRFAFFSEVAGVSSDAANRSSYSIVNYEVNTDFPGNNYFPGPILGRGARALAWTDRLILTSSPNAAEDITLPPGEFFIIGSQVLRFEYTFLLKAIEQGQPAEFSNQPYRGAGPDAPIDPNRVDGFRQVAAIVVGLGVLDEKSRNKLENGFSAVSYESIIAALPDSTGTSDILQVWKESIQALPSNEVTANLRIYQRYFYLD